MKNDKAAVCGSGGLAFERTNHMPRNMVIGKLKYLIGLASGTMWHPLGRSRFYFCPDVRV